MILEEGHDLTDYIFNFAAVCRKDRAILHLDGSKKMRDQKRLPRVHIIGCCVVLKKIPF